MATLTRARHRRRIAWILIALAFAGYYASGRLSARLTYTTASGANYTAGVEQAALALEQNQWTQNVSRSRWSFRHIFSAFHADGSWRPYHTAAAPWPATSSYHGLIIPLWPIPVAAIGYLMYTHGVVRGMRMRTTHACPSCGYDLQGLPGAQAMCPECGADTKAALTPPRPPPARSCTPDP